MTDQAHYEPPPDYSKAVEPGAAGPMFRGLFNATMEDNPQPRPSPAADAREPAPPPPAPRDQSLPPDDGGYRPPPRVDATGFEEIESAQAGPDDQGEGDESAAGESPPSTRMPPGLSQAEQERFKALPPEDQQWIFESATRLNSDRRQEGREAAEARRAREAVEQERAHYERNLKPLLDRLDKTYANKWQGVDWKALAEKDPVEAQKQFFEYQTFLADSRAAHAEAQMLTERQKQEAETRLRDHLASESEKLQKLIPDMADGRKRDKLIRDLHQAVLDYGFEPEIADNIADARMLHVVHDAMQWRRAQKARAEAERNPPPRQIRSGNGAPAPQVQRRVAATERLRRSGRVEDAADAFKGLLG